MNIKRGIRRLTHIVSIVSGLGALAYLAVEIQPFSNKWYSLFGLPIGYALPWLIYIVIRFIIEGFTKGESEEAEISTEKQSDFLSGFSRKKLLTIIIILVILIMVVVSGIWISNRDPILSRESALTMTPTYSESSIELIIGKSNHGIEISDFLWLKGNTYSFEMQTLNPAVYNVHYTLYFVNEAGDNILEVLGEKRIDGNSIRIEGNTNPNVKNRTHKVVVEIRRIKEWDFSGIPFTEEGKDAMILEAASVSARVLDICNNAGSYYRQYDPKDMTYTGVRDFKNINFSKIGFDQSDETANYIIFDRQEDKFLLMVKSFKGIILKKEITIYNCDRNDGQIWTIADSGFNEANKWFLNISDLNEEKSAILDELFRRYRKAPSELNDSQKDLALQLAQKYGISLE